jgi:hypothetical protein
MECVFTDINADHGDCAVEALGHGVFLCLWSPLPDSSLAGQEHGRTIPLADIARRCSLPEVAGFICQSTHYPRALVVREFVFSWMFA